MFKFIALCLLVVFARGQWSSYTSTKVNSIDIAAAAATGNGYRVLIGAPGYIYSAALPGQSKPTATGAAVAVSGTYFVTVTATTGTGAVVGVGIVRTPGSGSCTAATLLSEHSATSLQGGAATTTCPSDFLTAYTGAPAASPVTTSFFESATPSRMAVVSSGTATGYRWQFSNPDQATTANKCEQLIVTPYTINAAGTSTAGTAWATANALGVCATGSTATNGNTPAVYDLSAGTYSFYVELQGTGTAASLCFQTQAQWDAAPGNCFASIISGVLASIGLVVAVLFN